MHNVYVIMATEGPNGAERASGGALKNPFVGNVSKVVPLPSEHRGGAKKGRLQFDACFEGGERPNPAPPTFLE